MLVNKLKKCNNYEVNLLFIFSETQKFEYFFSKNILERDSKVKFHPKSSPSQQRQNFCVLHNVLRC